MTERVFEATCPAMVSRRLQTLKAAVPLPTWKRVEPTVFTVVLETGMKPQRVQIGNPHSCTCQKKQPCLHTLTVLLFAFHISQSNFLIWQQGLTELELCDLIQSGDQEPHPHTCRFCKERVLQTEGCGECGCQFHRKCLHLSARVRKQDFICPDCGSKYVVAPQSTQCSGCKTPVVPPYHQCALCAYYILCQGCYESKMHSHHPFRQCLSLSTTGETPVTETPQALMSRELNPEDYNTLLSLDSDNKKRVITESQFATLRHPLWGRRDNTETCPICLIPFCFKERCVCLPCGHVFHDTCGKTWLTTCKDSCPVDNTTVFSRK